jgi:polyhydroxybutyrate depolymerase
MFPGRASLPAALALTVLAVACSATSTSTGAGPEGAGDAGADAAPVDVPDPLIVARPYDVYVPKSYSKDKPAALVLAFHGYGDGDNGATLETYFQLKPVADKEGFLYITPNGIKDKDKQQFWNGTDACCDFYKKNPDDVAYVRAILDDVAKHYNLDQKRVFVTGLSAGGFFAHRLACDLSDRVAAVFSVSGATFADATKCKPKEGVAIIEMHGDKDATIDFNGGTSDYGDVSGVPYPSAFETVGHWARYNGCTGALTDTGVTYDLEKPIAGAETHVAAYSGCAKGSVELWTVQGGPHFTYLTPSFGPTVWSFFSAHPKK